MTGMHNSRSLIRAQQGMTVLEYAVIAAVVSLAALGVFTAAGGNWRMAAAWVAAHL